jgi:hypothetical protein
VAQGVDVGILFDAAGFEGEAEGALQRGAAHRFGGRARAQTAVAFGREEQDRMAMRFPLLAQKLQRAFGQRDVPVLIPLAGANVKEPPLGINVADLQPQRFAQAQAAGVKGDQGDAMIQGGHGGQQAAHFGSREHNGQFELGIGADQLQFKGPDAVERLFPEQLEGADGLRAGLAGDPLFRFEMDAILAEVLGRKQVGRLAVILADLADAGVIGLPGAGSNGQQLQVIGEGF